MFVVKKNFITTSTHGHRLIVFPLYVESKTFLLLMGFRIF